MIAHDLVKVQSCGITDTISKKCTAGPRMTDFFLLKTPMPARSRHKDLPSRGFFYVVFPPGLSHDEFYS